LRFCSETFEVREIFPLTAVEKKAQTQQTLEPNRGTEGPEPKERRKEKKRRREEKKRRREEKKRRREKKRREPDRTEENRRDERKDCDDRRRAIPSRGQLSRLTHMVFSELPLLVRYCPIHINIRKTLLFTPSVSLDIPLHLTLIGTLSLMSALSLLPLSLSLSLSLSFPLLFLPSSIPKHCHDSQTQISPYVD
jgi:hypothetical protein